MHWIRVRSGAGVLIAVLAAVQGGAVACMALAPALPAAALATAMVGLCTGPMAVISSVLGQVATPDELRGRVASLSTMTAYGAVLVASVGHRAGHRRHRHHRHVRGLGGHRGGWPADAVLPRPAAGPDRFALTVARIWRLCLPVGPTYLRLVPGSAMRTPFASAAGRSIARARRLWRFLGAAMLAVGLLMVLLALTVYLTQGSQIQVLATATAEHCHQQFDVGTGSTGARCDAAIRYTTRTGRVIRTTVTDAFPAEFRHVPGGPTTIEIRYDPNDPASPYKQSNYMPLDQFLLVLGIGCVATGAGSWWLARADRMARKAVSLRTMRQ